jgi:hypothetical protein
LTRSPAANDAHQVINVHDSIAYDIRRTSRIAALAPRIDRHQKIINVHFAVAITRCNVGGALRAQLPQQIATFEC